MDKKKYVLYPLSRDLSRRWVLRFWQVLDSKKKRLSIWIPDFATAKERLDYALDYEKRINELGYPLPKLETATTNAAKLLVERFAERKPALRRKTIFCYESVLKSYCNYLASRKHTLEVGDAYLSFLRDAGKSAATINKHRTVLLSLYVDLVKSKKVRFNPFLETQKAKGQSTGAAYFKIQQIQQLKSYMLQNMPFLWQPVQWIYYCFIRPGELRQLKIGDIDFDDWKIRVPAEVSKNAKTQWVLLPDAFRQALEPMCLYQFDPNFYIVGRGGVPSAEMMPYNWLSRHHLDMLRALNFTDAYCLYSWKHTGVCQSYKAGMGLRQLQMQLRHHSLDMVEVYLRSMGILEVDGIRDRVRGI
jgi:integrase